MFATVSLNSILKHDPCKSGLEAFKLKFGNLDPDTPVPLIACLESNSVSDVIWALRAVHQDISSVIPLIAADFAESVLHIFEGKFPSDDRPRKAIEAARGRDKRKAAEAASAAHAADAADAAHAAHAADAADAARAAAYAARAAAKAARAAAYAAHAAHAAAYVACDADAASRDAERLKQAEVLRKYFSQE